MTKEEAFARYRDLMKIQQRLNKFAENYDTCGLCGAKHGMIKAGYYHYGMSGGLPRAMCKPCREANLLQALAAVPKGTHYTHHYTPWRDA